MGVTLSEPDPSPIGFGAYRVAAGVREHEQALRLALELGCRLIDTAATYTGGRSELLVGRVLRGWTGPPVYVMTKAGYRGSGHSFDPDFLRAELARSLARLELRRVDAFLLHDPEQWHRDRHDADPDEFYRAIERAFAFLEEEAERGTIGCYGICSDKLHLSTDYSMVPNLRRLIDIARRTSAEPHFGVVQLPFNIMERDALEPHHDGVSVVELARSAGLRLVANRPLNAITPHGAVRLATHDGEREAQDRRADERVVAAAVTLIEHRLEGAGLADESVQGLLEHLRMRWSSLASPEVVDDLLARQVWPLLWRAYKGPPPAAEGNVYARFQRTLRTAARRNLDRSGCAVRQRLIDKGELDAADRRPLALIACQYPLDVGIDHVLVGMRRPRYVELLSPLFTRSARHPALLDPADSTDLTAIHAAAAPLRRPHLHPHASSDAGAGVGGRGDGGVDHPAAGDAGDARGEREAHGLAGRDLPRGPAGPAHS